ncbi:hypothetical protein ACPPVT_07420 [Angustibacter sp. McL0619]|uniref:hypothetical protein n=1 Tax=Angustibacter sp. McL0619 TaxID=3415676 RepID=UPI003CE9C9AB
MDWLPAASRHPYPVDAGDWTQRTDPKGCLHTTEGSGWPSYDDGAKAPHATVLPTPGKGVDVRQHTPFSRAARALRNAPGGVQTNRDYVLQFELIGTCAKGGPGYYWPDADDAVLADLYRKVIKPASDALHIPIAAPSFQAYPDSFGESNPRRFSGPHFDTYSGWLGHQHVPENDHGDPGAFPWDRMIAAAGGNQEDEVVTDADKKDIADLAVSELLGKSVQVGSTTEPFGLATGRTRATVKRLEPQLAALSAAVAALATSVGADPAAIEALVSSKVDAALADLRIVQGDEA